MRKSVVVILVVSFLLVAILVTGCDSEDITVAGQSVEVIDTSRAWIGKDTAVIPVGKSQDPTEWISVLDAFERQQKVRINSWSYTEAVYRSADYPQPRTHALLVTFTKLSQ